MGILSLFGLSALFSLLGALRREPALFTLLSALSALAALLGGLVLGWTLEDLLPPLLSVTALTLFIRRGGRRT